MLFELSNTLTNRCKSTCTVLIIQAIIPGVHREVRAVTQGVSGRPGGAPEVRGGRNGIPELGGPRAGCSGVSQRHAADPEDVTLVTCGSKYAPNITPYAKKNNIRVTEKNLQSLLHH